MRKKLNVLIACEESQAECIAFRNLGHNAYSCDIKECRKGGNPDWHIHTDVTPFLAGKKTFTTQSGKKRKVKAWDLIIAHPPCTYLCRVSSVWLYKKPLETFDFHGTTIELNEERYKSLNAGREFFFRCLNSCVKYLAVENPIPMKIAELPRPDFYIDPSWYGVKYTKKTYFWVKNLPPLMPTCIYANPKSFVRNSRGKYRSRTFPQVAEQIARQWAQYILDDMNMCHAHGEARAAVSETAAGGGKAGGKGVCGTGQVRDSTATK